MRVDVVDLRRRYSRLLDGQVHRGRRALAFGMWLGNVMRVRCRPVACQFADRLSTSGLRVTLRFQDHHACAFAQYEAVAFRIKRPRRAFWFVVAEG